MSSRPIGSLPYDSAPLAALLGIFAQWGSGGFMAALARESGLDLDPTSIVAITVLAREGAMRPSALADHLRVGASNVSKISNRLAELGLLERVQDAQDARATLVRLTSEGTDTMSALVAAGDEMMSVVLADWAPTDRTEFARLMQHFERDVTRFSAVIQTPAAPTPEN